jgi:hypothetical protein
LNHRLDGVESTSETSENVYQTARRKNPEGSYHHTRRLEDPKSDILTVVVEKYSRNKEEVIQPALNLMFK